MPHRDDTVKFLRPPTYLSHFSTKLADSWLIERAIQRPTQPYPLRPPFGNRKPSLLDRSIFAGHRRDVITVTPPVTPYPHESLCL